jgi:dephospho-CoA kinase
MLKVAVTGGIGSGKSMVCSLFEKLCIPVFYADDVAKTLLDSDIEIREMLIKNFGTGIFDTNFKLNRTKFASIIFNNKKALSTTNEIVHPVVRKEFNSWAEHQNSPYVIQEAALIFESGQSEYFDKIITVSAPVEIRIERVMKRDNIAREKVLERIKNQLDEEIKCKQSDFIIVNDSKQMLLPQIINIHNNLHQ